MAKLYEKGSSATPFRLIKREEGVGLSFVSSPPLPSLQRVTSVVARAPAYTIAPATAVSEPCTSTVPCLTEPHHRRHDPVRTSSARTTTEPWVTAAVAPAEPSLPPLVIAARTFSLHSCRASATYTLCCCYTVHASTASSVAQCPWHSKPCPAPAVCPLPSLVWLLQSLCEP